MSKPSHLVPKGRPQQGQTVLFNMRLTRNSQTRHQSLSSFTEFRCWEPTPMPQGTKGVYIGYRILKNGTFHMNDTDGGDGWKTTETFCAFLVAYSEIRDPVYVLPAHCMYEIQFDEEEG